MSASSSSTAASLPGRIASLDQFRGYTVAGMFLVNFIGGFAVVHEVFKHHNTDNSYADTIMPHFFFAVGYAYRLTLLRRLATLGPVRTYLRVLQRALGLIVIGWVVYHLEGRAQTWTELKDLGLVGFLTSAFHSDPFETLVHIGVTTLWIMPVIAASAWVRLAFMLFSTLLHVVLSKWFYFHFTWVPGVIDGGPLGFLTWTIPALVGSFAYDWMAANRESPPVARLAGVGAVLMLLGYALSFPTVYYMPSDTPAFEKDPKVAAYPFTPPSRQSNDEGVGDWKSVLPFKKAPADMKRNYFMMCQKSGTPSYLIFSAGFSLAVYALFVLVSDIGGLKLGIFSTFGQNALAAYVLHGLVSDAVKPYAPRDASVWWVMFAFAIFFGTTYLIVRHL